MADEPSSFPEIAADLEKYQEGIGNLVCRALKIPRERLKKVIISDAHEIFPGRSQVDFKFEPPLTKAENEELKLFLEFSSAFLGARKPLFLEVQ
jgi:hypothetical protein